MVKNPYFMVKTLYFMVKTPNKWYKNPYFYTTIHWSKGSARFPTDGEPLTGRGDLIQPGLTKHQGMPQTHRSRFGRRNMCNT